MCGLLLSQEIRGCRWLLGTGGAWRGHCRSSSLLPPTGAAHSFTRPAQGLSALSVSWQGIVSKSGQGRSVHKCPWYPQCSLTWDTWQVCSRRRPDVGTESPLSERAEHTTSRTARSHQTQAVLENTRHTKKAPKDPEHQETGEESRRGGHGTKPKHRHKCLWTTLQG